MSFHGACGRGEEQAVRDLVRLGVDINCTRAGFSGLIFAALRGHENIVRFLLSLPGIDVNMVDSTGHVEQVFLSPYSGHVEQVYSTWPPAGT